MPYKAKWDQLTSDQRERQLAKARAWRKANPETVREGKKRYYQEHPEQRKKEREAYYARHRDRILASQKVARTANHDDWIAKQRARRAANPERFRDKSREHRVNNPNMWRLYGIRKAAKAKGIECDLDVEWFTIRIEAGVCELSGLPFDIERKSPRGPNTPSVDRIDPKGPYTKANCRLILWWLNHALQDKGEDYAIAVFRGVIAKKDASQ